MNIWAAGSASVLIFGFTQLWMLNVCHRLLLVTVITSFCADYCTHNWHLTFKTANCLK